MVSVTWILGVAFARGEVPVNAKTCADFLQVETSNGGAPLMPGALDESESWG